MTKVKVLVMAGYGLNCDHETAYAFELDGAEAVLRNRPEDNAQPFVPMLVHVNDKEKLIFLLEEGGEFPADDTLDANFHIQFTNYQANLSEALAVATVILPAP